LGFNPILYSHFSFSCLLEINDAKVIANPDESKPTPAIAPEPPVAATAVPPRIKITPIKGTTGDPIKEVRDFLLIFITELSAIVELFIAIVFSSTIENLP